MYGKNVEDDDPSNYKNDDNSDTFKTDTDTEDEEEIDSKDDVCYTI